MEVPNSTLEYYIIHYICPYDFYFKLWFKFYHWWMDMWCERQTRWAPRFVCVWLYHMCLNSHWGPDHSSATSGYPEDQVLEDHMSLHGVKFCTSGESNWKRQERWFFCFLYLICYLFSPYFFKSFWKKLPVSARPREISRSKIFPHLGQNIKR